MFDITYLPLANGDWAFFAQSPTSSLLVHSDCGGQYCGHAYRQLLHDHEAVRS